METDQIQHLALLMANVCVRNTVIEEYHANGQLSQDDMKAFNQEVANKIFTFLRLAIFNADNQEAMAFMGMATMQFPHGWDQPHDDADFVHALEKYRQRTGQ